MRKIFLIANFWLCVLGSGSRLSLGTSDPDPAPSYKQQKLDDTRPEWIQADDKIITKWIDEAKARRAKERWQSAGKKAMEGDGVKVHNAKTFSQQVRDNIISPVGAAATAGAKGAAEAIKAAGSAAKTGAIAAKDGVINAGQKIGEGGRAISKGVRTIGKEIKKGAESVKDGAVAGVKQANKGLNKGWENAKTNLKEGYKEFSKNVKQTYNTAKVKTAAYKAKVQSNINALQKADKDGVMKKFIEEQNKKNMARMNELTKNTLKTGMAMQNAMSVKQQKFDTGAQNAKKSMEGLLAKSFDKASADFGDMVFDVNPGSGVVDGQVLTPSSFHASIEKMANDPDIWANIGDQGDEKVINNNDIEDLLIKECYRSIASNNQEQVDKNCLKADILTYKCESPIDAAAYIGVTFDITKGYSMKGYRGKLVKPWCREMKKYKGQFDVPDGMHVQGVYETQMTTETFSSISDFIESESVKSNAQVGTSAFDETRKTLDSTEVDSLTATASIAASGNGFSLGASFQHQKSTGKFTGEHTFSNSKRQRKASQLGQTGKKKTVKKEKMVAKMSINVIRYEMFLREVAPNYITSTFLDCFLSLPQSFFAPGAPAKFQDFIQRYGTHFVKAARFGGQLTVTKTKEVTGQTVVSDLREEAQGEFNSIVGSGSSKATTTRNEESNTFSLNAGAKNEQKGTSGALSLDVSTGSFDETNEAKTSQTADIDTTSTAEGTRNVGQTSSTEMRDTTSVVAKGGSHQIATSISDLYSTNFRSNLVQWLKSIAHYPKPFDMVFEPLTTLMYHMLDDMIDGDCFKTCLIEREENCIKERKTKVSCSTAFGQNNPACKQTCRNNTLPTAECEVNSPRLVSCWEIVDQKDKFKRKIEALDTAITEYVKDSGGLINKVTEIKPSPVGCTTDYKAIDIRDPFVFDFGDDETIDWPSVAFANLQLIFNMKRFYFNSNDNHDIRIFPNEQYFLLFDENERRWYTKDTIDETTRSSIAAPVVPFTELMSADTSGRGNFHLIPRTVSDGDESFVQLRLKQGLYIDLNLKNGDLTFTERNLVAMAADSVKDSPNESACVRKFYNNYKDTLEKMAAGEGQTLGFINPILAGTKTPFPCMVPWSSGQMFESAQDIQQCVKVTVKTKREYFFVMASNLADKSTWIYLHQTLNNLCLHKLDQTLEYDEIGVCAQRYGRMATGNIPDIAEQLIVCMYNVGNLISFTVNRPSYDRNQREAAISIINYNIVQHPDRGDFITPRYYALGGGESKVGIEGIFMTEVETLQCQLPYRSEEIGGTYRCVLDCSDLCSNHGCLKPEDPAECYTCKYGKLVVRQPNSNTDISQCLSSDAAASCDDNKEEFAAFRYDNNMPDLITTLSPDPQYQDPGEESQRVCVSCHEECSGACSNGGLTDKDCKASGQKNKCKNVEYEYEPDKVQCLPECPIGFYAEEKPSTIDPAVYPSRFVCKACDPRCVTCDLVAVENIMDITETVVKTTAAKCLTCHNDFLTAVVDTKHRLCIINEVNADGSASGNACTSDPDTCCPEGFQRFDNAQTGQKRCIKKWRSIGYQKVDEDVFEGECKPDCETGHVGTALCTLGCFLNQGSSFLALESKLAFDKFLTEAWLTTEEQTKFPDGFFSFQLAWKIDDCTVDVLEWKQDLNPLASSSNAPVVEIESFNRIKCQISDPALGALKKVSFESQNFFINCPPDAREITSLIADEADILAPTEAGNSFLGLKLATGAAVGAYMLEGSTIGAYSFGRIEPAVGGSVASYIIDGTTTFSSEMQLSVHDDRMMPLGWSVWYPQLGEDLTTSGLFHMSATDYEAKYKCKKNCGADLRPDLTDLIVGEIYQERYRYCRCWVNDIDPTNYAVQSGDNAAQCAQTQQSINDADCPYTFKHYCQPCIGINEKITNDCTLDGCPSAGETACATSCAQTTNTVMHHACCETSAIRIFGKNRYGNQLRVRRADNPGQVAHSQIDINGIYELMYHEETAAHTYWFMNGQDLSSGNLANGENPVNLAQSLQYIKVEQDQTDKRWHLKVSRDLGQNYETWFRSKSANCPASATDWAPYEQAIIDQRVDQNAEIEVVCSKGRNTCPETHPFAYDFGRHCCNSPIFDNSDPSDTTSRLLLANDVEPCQKNLDGTCIKSSCTTDGTTDGLCDTTKFSPCLGAFVKCQLLPSPCRGDMGDDGFTVIKPPCNRCRTNLDSPIAADFKALSNAGYKYRYENCERHCNSVYIIPELQP